MTYYNIVNKNHRVQCSMRKGKYSYDIMEDNKSFNIGVITKPPLELTKQSTVGKSIFKRIKENADSSMDMDKEFRLILEKMDKNLQDEKDTEIKNETERIDEEYELLYANFQYNLEKYNLNPLQYIIYVFDGLGVNASLEITKAFCGYLQTYLGLKGTNVIGIGSQSSGKTHCIENPLKCIPDEYVHRGVYSRASFFTEFAGRDLTYHIFYLGDLGGGNDDANTIEFRDELKKLSTDGFTSRTIKDPITGEIITETITGYPAIVYTTVSEEMVNSQEASRSMLIMPPDVNQRRLIAYNSFINSPGVLIDLLQNINEHRDSIKGFVWWLSKKINHVELYNPFMFCVQRYLTNMGDFNRKIREFEELLKIICILNNSFHLTHDLYVDDDLEPIETTLYIPSKQDVIDALNLFEGSTGLLPSEIALTKGLLKYFSEVPSDLSELPDELPENLDGDSSFEEIVYYNAVHGKNPVIDEVTDEKDKPYLEGYNTKILTDDGEEACCFFSISDVRKGHSSERWYREVKDELSKKLNKLYSFGILIKLGQNNKGENVYAFAENVRSKVESIEPVFGSKDIQLATDLFHARYPMLIEDYDNYVPSQAKLKTKNTNFEFKKNELYDLFWNNLKEE